MKTFKRVAAQGEAYFMKLEPGTIAGQELKELAPEKPGVHIIAHSETGHHHVMEREGVKVYEPVNSNPDTAVGILYMIVEKPTVLEHLRPYDTHESIMFEPGEYKVTLQQEYTPEGYRRVAD